MKCRSALDCLEKEEEQKRPQKALMEWNFQSLLIAVHAEVEQNADQDRKEDKRPYKIKPAAKCPKQSGQKAEKKGEVKINDREVDHRKVEGEKTALLVRRDGGKPF